jgi:hypothetical protein
MADLIGSQHATAGMRIASGLGNPLRQDVVAVRPRLCGDAQVVEEGVHLEAEANPCGLLGCR